MSKNRARHSLLTIALRKCAITEPIPQYLRTIWSINIVFVLLTTFFPQDYEVVDVRTFVGCVHEIVYMSCLVQEDSGSVVPIF